MGGVFDSAISGEMKENGFWNTMGSVTVSTIVSTGVGAFSKWGVSKLKARSLKKMTNSIANSKLRRIGINTKIGSNIVKKSKTGLSEIIKNSNWIGNIVADYGTSSIMGGVLSSVWSYYFNGRWF